jgi:nickel-dependent lactate racemase
MTAVKMSVDEHFDRTLTIKFPESWSVKTVNMEGHDASPLTTEEIRAALNQPIGSPTIADLVKGKTGKIVITCDDLTRPTPAYRVIPFIVEELVNSGVSDNQIFIMGAYGLHAEMNVEAYGRKVGWDIVRRFDCVNHNAFKNHQNLGKTSRGTPLLVDSEFADADVKIIVCGIKKHGLSGAGGSGKHIVPGVASFETIDWNHHVLGPTSKRGIWTIKDNDVREDMQEAGRMAQVDLVVNCCYNGSRELAGLFIGDLDASWHEAVKYSYQLHSTRLPTKPADIVVVNSYLQAQQGIDWWPANSILREGGTAIAIHQYTPGWSLTHYRVESVGIDSGYWGRMKGYPNRPWPVKQAGNIIVWSDKIAMRNRLRYNERVEWMSDWDNIIHKLTAIHGEDATVDVFPCSKIQFDSNTPLNL